MTARQTVTRVGDRTYRVDSGGQTALVYVARSGTGWWAFCNGDAFRVESDDRHDLRETEARRGGRAKHAGGQGADALAAPMPATVLKVLVREGDLVKKGDTVVVLEAMKMELPLRAPAEARVGTVHCREGELVTPDSVLVTFTSA